MDRTKRKAGTPFIMPDGRYMLEPSSSLLARCEQCRRMLQLVHMHVAAERLAAYVCGARCVAQPRNPSLLCRPLGLFLVENNLLHGDKPASKKGKKRPGAIRIAKDGWTKPVAAKAAVAAPRTPGASSGGAYSDAEAMELEALARVGQRRRRRFMNDKLLRDMAGTLTARDMASRTYFCCSPRPACFSFPSRHALCCAPTSTLLLCSSWCRLLAA